MNWRNKIVGILGLLTIAGCGEPTTTDNGLPINFWIQGQVNGAENSRMYVEASTQDGVVDVAQVDVEADGSFKISGNIPGLGIYQLRLGEGNNNVVPLTLQPNDTLTIEATANTFATAPKFSGTNWAKPLTQYFEQFNAFSKTQMEFQQSNPNASEQEAMGVYLAGKDKIDAFAKNQIQQDPSNPVNIILTSGLQPSMGFETWDSTNMTLLHAVKSAYLKNYPDSPFAKRMAEQVDQIDVAYQQFLAQKEIMKNGLPAPEIALQNPEGKTLKLSDLKGKYVLIDFWASWCGPCRRENPNVVRLYNEYKNKNFTILSVSLDEDKAKWEAAILQDGLVWPYHVSDLKGWKTPLTIAYNFNSIPHTVLVDPKGNIIAQNLRGLSLEQKLKELL